MAADQGDLAPFVEFVAEATRTTLAKLVDDFTTTVPKS
jgi:hypothetical protein